MSEFFLLDIVGINGGTMVHGHAEHEVSLQLCYLDVHVCMLPTRTHAFLNQYTHFECK